MLSKQDGTETTWGPHSPSVWRPCKSPEAGCSLVLLPGLLLPRLPVAIGAVRAGDPVENKPSSSSTLLQVCGNGCSVQGTLMCIPSCDPHSTSVKRQSTHESPKRNCYSQKPRVSLRSDHWISNPDLLKSGPVYLIFNPSSKHFYHDASGQMAGESDVLEPCTHTKHYHLITRSCKLLPIASKVAG